MGFIYCPECGSRISDKAKECPYCGFRNTGKLIPISKMNLSIVPVRLNVPDIAIFDDGSNLLSNEDNNLLYSFFSDVNNLQKYTPAIYDVVKKWAGGETALVADISKKAQDLMKEGTLTFNIEKKTGELLPTLRNVDTGKIYEQVRLKEQILPADVGPAIVNLQQQVMMASILNEIKQLSHSVEEIQHEMMDDRLAEAEAVWYELQQAIKIQDTQLRNIKVLSLQTEATKTRLKLEKNFERNMLRLNTKKLKADQRGHFAEDALNELSVISLMARGECASYYLLGEKNAGLYAIEQYGEFIENNKLNKRSTLIKINEYTRTDASKAINEFLNITTNIQKLQLQDETQGRMTIEQREDDYE